MKNRMKSVIGLPTADAAAVTGLELAAALISESLGALLVAAAASVTEPAVLPNSRRLKANAVHIRGAATGTSPLVPAPNHEISPLPRPDTEELFGAACIAVISGARAAAWVTTTPTPAAAGEGEESTSAGESDATVVARSASAEPGNVTAVETELSIPALPDPAGIEGAKEGTADSETSDR